MTVVAEAKGQVSKFPVLKVDFSGWRSSKRLDWCMEICCLIGLEGVWPNTWVDGLGGVGVLPCYYCEQWAVEGEDFWFGDRFRLTAECCCLFWPDSFRDRRFQSQSRYGLGNGFALLYQQFHLLEFDRLFLNKHVKGKSILWHWLSVRKLISYRYLGVAFLTRIHIHILIASCRPSPHSFLCLRVSLVGS